jgi:hypothetical protein
MYRDYTSALEDFDYLLQAPKSATSIKPCCATPCRVLCTSEEDNNKICEAEHVRGPLYIERFCTWLGRNEGTKESKPDTHSTPSTRAQKLNPGSVSGRNSAVRVGQPSGRKEGRSKPRTTKERKGCRWHMGWY